MQVKSIKSDVSIIRTEKLREIHSVRCDGRIISRMKALRKSASDLSTFRAIELKNDPKISKFSRILMEYTLFQLFEGILAITIEV